MKKLLALLIVTLSVNLSMAGPFGEGSAAYKRGDYATAKRLWQSYADNGDSDAQYNLGLMYGKGIGIPQDHAEAMRWYKLAAAQGKAGAQYNLGLMYGLGKGVPQDYVRAHLWSNLAAVKGNLSAVKVRDFAAKKMTTQQIAEAQKMSRECLASNYKKCD